MLDMIDPSVAFRNKVAATSWCDTHNGRKNDASLQRSRRGFGVHLHGGSLAVECRGRHASNRGGCVARADVPAEIWVAVLVAKEAKLAVVGIGGACSKANVDQRRPKKEQ